MDIALMNDEKLNGYYCMRSQLRDHIYNRAQKYFDNAKKERAEIYTKEQLEAYNKAMREKFISGIGGIAWDRAPLNARVTSSKDYEHYRMENIIFTSRKDTYVTSTMYIPHGLKEPSAAVLFVCGHSDGARYNYKYQSACDTIARAGLIVFAIDPVGQGERVSYFDYKTGEYIVKPCVDDHDCSGIPATATGKFLQSYFLSDEMRAIDYMLTRPEIDPKRIGVTGNSGGGTQTMALMAADSRIAAAAPGTFVTSRESYMYSGQPQDSEQIWHGITEAGYDHINPVMNFAPKPVAILAVNYDFFCIEGTVETYNEAKRFYEMYGKAQNLELYRDDSLHQYSPYLQRCAAKFFAKHLLGKNVDIDNSNFKAKPITDFFCTNSGRVRGEIEGARFIHQENNDIAEKLYDERHSMPAVERLLIARNWLKTKVCSYRTPYDFYIRRFEPSYSETLIAYSAFWHSQKDLFNYGIFIRSRENDGKKLPVIIAVWDNGTMAADSHGEWIENKCREGYEVLVLDVTGTGSIESDEIGNYGKHKWLGTFYKFSCDLMYMNDSMTALRSYDALRSVEMLKSEYSLDEADISIYCEGAHGVYGVIAAFLNKNVGVIYGDGLINSVYEEKIRPFARTEYESELEVILPSMLRYFDYNEIMR